MHMEVFAQKLNWLGLILIVGAAVVVYAGSIAGGIVGPDPRTRTVETISYLTTGTRFQSVVGPSLPSTAG